MTSLSTKSVTRNIEALHYPKEGVTSHHFLYPKPTNKLCCNVVLQVTGVGALAHDYSLSSIMSGHKSVVSTLAVCSEVLYGGSWDGTIRLWCVSDHSPLVVLGEEAPIHGSVLSLAAHTHTIVAGHENGCTKFSNILTLTNSLTMMWNNDVPLSPISAHPSSIFSIYKEGQWLYSGGWNMNVVVQVIPLPSNKTVVVRVEEEQEEVLRSVERERGQTKMGTCSRRVSFGLQDFKRGYRRSIIVELVTSKKVLKISIQRALCDIRDLIRRVTCGYPWPELEGKGFGMIQERLRSSAWCLSD
ncbi:zinc ion binding protein [Tanacetum coccineum]|uniref:Zinc ion binding protein n=1 Tax=Tanacetum coccineum TaxID=301880 RepID=A0ABQ4XEB1_9ASTR